MFTAILIIFLTIMALLILHELGHFILAKKFGVEVEEFGVGYPPRIFGKKFGGTFYSLNLLPFGAFVKIKGEEENINHPASFSQKPIWQRMLIIIGGVASFWIIAFLLLTFIAAVWGIPTSISDNFQNKNAYVQIVAVSPNSPALSAGIKEGDIIAGMKFGKQKIETNRIKTVQAFVQNHLGENINLLIKRKKRVIDIQLVPRLSHLEGEGAIGIGLARVSKLKYPFYFAPLVAAKITAQKTADIPKVFVSLIGKALEGKKMEGIKIVGPIGMGKLMSQALGLGADNFLMFVAMIAIWLAFFNILPIPALDGGKLLFLAIEWVKRKPISQKIEKNVTMFFFLALIFLMVFVTIKDIIGLF